MFNVCVRFKPNQKNPARASGRGVYRVVGCTPWPHAFTKLIRVGKQVGGPFISIISTRALKVGSRVDPLRIALEKHG